MARRTVTFRVDGKLLTGRAARKAWAAQVAGCACGDPGDERYAVAGVIHGQPAEWLGCENCRNQALGRPLVFKLPKEIR